jgi:hypothetical protein
MQLPTTTCARLNRIPCAARRSMFGEVSGSWQPNAPMESAF